MTLKTDTEIICLPLPEMSTSLKMRVRLKHNAKALAWSLNLWRSGQIYLWR